MSGLCREGQLEIGVQEARKRRPDVSDDALLELAKEIHKLSRVGVTKSALGQSLHMMRMLIGPNHSDVFNCSLSSATSASSLLTLCASSDTLTRSEVPVAIA